MGEEEKQPEEKKEEEKKKEEPSKAAEDNGKKEEKKSEESKAEEPPAPPPPPQEIVLKVYMHCEGCARKVRRCLKGFPGVEDVITDCRASKVVVKGERADPLKVFERIQRKSHRQVELISPIPTPAAEEPKKPEEKEEPKPEEKKEEPAVITAVLGVYMHCEACAQEIKKRIQRMKGVQKAEPDLKASQVSVKGIFDPEKLTDYVYKRTGKHAVIVKVEPEKKEEKPKEENQEKKSEEAEKEAKKEEEKGGKDTKEGVDAAPDGGSPPPKMEIPAEEEDPKLELKKNEFYYYNYPHNLQVHEPQSQRFVHEEYYHAYPPQMFSDENPNACTVM